MKKIVLLMPMLMLDNNRKENNAALDYALEHYDVDLIAINAQEFKEYDYRRMHNKICYIEEHAKRQGFVKSRNQLLEWFYESQFDWAVWLDANAKVSRTSLNDFRTVISAIKNDAIDVDVILSTLGMYISDMRIVARKAPDHLENVKLTKLPKNKYAWMNGMFMVNFNAKYNKMPDIDTECGPEKGIGEDSYFVQLCRNLFEVRICPTIMISKPPVKTSTWKANEKGYKYQREDWNLIARMVQEKGIYLPEKKKLVPDTIILSRVDYMKEKVTVYKRKRKQRKGLI